MPSTHISLHYHIVFSTKERRRIIADPWRDELHAYLGGITREFGAIARSIGGTGDHVHILAGLKATHTVADVVRHIKRGSSAWIHQHGINKFAWQEGYGAFSYGHSQLDTIVRYIMNQEKHHRRRSFRDEYLTLLRKFEIEFKEEYVFEFYD